MKAQKGILGGAVWVTLLAAASAPASRLAEVRVIDQEHIMVRFQDGTVVYKDDGKGPGAFQGHESGRHDKVILFAPELNLTLAKRPATFSIRSTEDDRYRSAAAPAVVWRKSKVNGAPNVWPEPPHTMDHTLFLKVVKPLKPGTSYTLSFQKGLGSDLEQVAVKFSTPNSETEAIHVNLMGYPRGGTQTADLYAWLGDGGARDYSAFESRPVLLVSAGGKRTAAGVVSRGSSGGPDYGNWDYAKSTFWHCDFKSDVPTGKYRLFVEGIGYSREFSIGENAYSKAFAESLVGFYYMRIGEPAVGKPIPRQPRLIPKVDPPDYVVYRTTYGPWHPDWTKSGRDTWDVTDWSMYREPGNPTNPNAWGGHSDACDWDRHAGHVSIIYDMLLPYILTSGQPGSDQTGIRESGNGIPDIIDEAQNEVDFWLRLRDGEGNYSFGLNNPDKDHKVLYQAGARPYMAWVNSANCAMIADAYRIAKKPRLEEKYRVEALEAWKRAKNQDLDYSYGIGNGKTRGRDYKMMAAAFLYRLTGERAYEDVIAEESVVKSSVQTLDSSEKYCQYWGTAAYLDTEKRKLRTIRFPALVERMKDAAIKNANEKCLSGFRKWPSRRSSDTTYGWFQSIITVTPLILVHALDLSPGLVADARAALLAEADWSLGRNPLNRILMTGSTTLHVNDIYTSGRNDGEPGVHPGHTPYMNAAAWGSGYMADPMWYATKGYPEWSKWPHGEALWAARYCFSNNEFTPQQAMRGKTLLYAYLAALELSKRD